MPAGDVDPADPPPVPDGHVVAPPDFVGVGVQKAGTTWWYDQLAAHPEVHHRPGRPKELHFFDRFFARPFGRSDVEGYHRWFARPGGALAGEWTPRYLHDWWVPALLARAAPAARLLVLLRDPVERYRSGVAHELRSRGRPDPAIAGDAARRSCYAAQLRRLHERFDADRVLVLQLERCIDDPAAQLARTYAACGLDDSFLPDDHQVPANVTDGDRPPPPDAVRDALRAELADDLSELAALVPDLDLDRWPSARWLLGP